MTRLDDRIAQLEARLKQETVKKQNAEVLQRTRTAKRSRQDDTRRKIFVGALIILLAQKDLPYKAELGRLLDQAST